MFKRGNLTAKYRAYVKSVKSCKSTFLVKNNQNDLEQKCLFTLKGAKYGKLQTLHTESLKRCMSVIASMRDTATEKSKPLKEKSRSIQANLQTISTEILERISTRHRGKLGISAAAIGLFKQDPVTVAGYNNTVIVEPIPEPPVVPDIADAVASNINSLGEATFASLGLGGWTPVGIVQNCFEFLHVSYGLPWWECIAIGTVIIRFLLFPLVIISQRNAARMNNHLPQLQVIQLKMTEARQTGNQLEAARYSQELMSFMKDKNVNPLKNMIVPLAQMPVFLSFFVGLRQMANVPVESLRTGGMLWFTDLTVPDQFFLLPVITSITLFATIELGTDSAKLSAQNMQTMKYVLRALPLIILPFTVNFPGVILCYWATSNLVSLGQVGFLKIPAVRRYFNIDALIAHNPANLPVKSKGFIGGIKESWTNLKITRELEDRRRLDEMQFQRAGKGPLVKTYKYDPTKPTMSAKGR